MDRQIGRGNESVLLDSANCILLSVSDNTGDFVKRSVDTRTKEKPTKTDLRNINTVIEVLMSRNKQVSPNKNPFEYLWLVDCVLYSVVAAFLLLKGWKKETPGQSDCARNKPTAKWKRVHEEKVMETRKKISIAKAEMERIKVNRQLTKRGRKNR